MVPNFHLVSCYMLLPICLRCLFVVHLCTSLARRSTSPICSRRIASWLLYCFFSGLCLGRWHFRVRTVFAKLKDVANCNNYFTRASITRYVHSGSRSFSLNKFFKLLTVYLSNLSHTKSSRMNKLSE